MEEREEFGMAPMWIVVWFACNAPLEGDVRSRARRKVRSMRNYRSNGIKTQ